VEKLDDKGAMVRNEFPAVGTLRIVPTFAGGRVSLVRWSYTDKNGCEHHGCCSRMSEAVACAAKFGYCATAAVPFAARAMGGRMAVGRA
jgi:hypothetical protein